MTGDKRICRYTGDTLVERKCTYCGKLLLVVEGKSRATHFGACRVLSARARIIRKSDRLQRLRVA